MNRTPQRLDASACRICGSPSLSVYHDQGYRRLLKCSSCRVVFADPMPTWEEKQETERQAYVGALLPETAEFFQNCHRNFAEDAVIRGFRHTLEHIEKHRKPGRLLDIGPGPGVFLHIARERGWDVRGIDICDISADKAAQEFGLTVDVGQFETFPYEPGSFDCISMLDVLEHSRDPLAFLARARELLKPGGVLCIAVPNQRCLLTVICDRFIHLGMPGGDWFLERLYVSPHLYYFNPRLMLNVLRRARLEPIGMTGGNVYLGRYRLPLWMRIPLEVVLEAGSLVGMSARVHALARKPGP